MDFHFFEIFVFFCFGFRSLNLKLSEYFPVIYGAKIHDLNFSSFLTVLTLKASSSFYDANERLQNVDVT